MDNLQPGKSATLTWDGVMQFTATGPTNHTIALDASPNHGGQGGGPQPTDLVLMALGSCTAMDVIAILQKKRQQVTKFEVRVEGFQRDEQPRIFTKAVLTYIITGNNVDPNAVARAIELSITKYCPVHAMLAPTVEITTHYEVHPAIAV